MVTLVLMLALQASVSLASEPSCRAVDSRIVHRYSERVLVARDREEFAEHLARLIRYWRRQCEVSRNAAGVQIVDDLSRLLASPHGRFDISRMLSDIGPNLRHASPALESALNDQLRRGQPSPDDLLGSVRTGDGVTVPSLRCVLKKARTGAWDARLCWAIDSANKGRRAESGGNAPVAGTHY